LKLKIDFEIPKKVLASNWPSFFLIGSCFAESQAERMGKMMLDNYSNPFGILYNPISIEKIIRRISNNQKYSTTNFDYRKDYFSFEHHGNFKYKTVENAITDSNKKLDDAHTFLKNANVVVLTLGTSLVYIQDNEVVANCHKLPNNEFEQRQLSFDEVKTSIENIIQNIRIINAHAHILFTVSPIRHLRSGIKESSRTKAVLLAAIHQVIETLDNVSYFPSFEIFIDELRDYRFAKEDLTHPSLQAENYIWERFCETYFSSETIKILKDANKYNQFASHRPIHSNELHNLQVAEKKSALLNKHPFLNIK